MSYGDEWGQDQDQYEGRAPRARSGGNTTVAVLNFVLGGLSLLCGVFSFVAAGTEPVRVARQMGGLPGLLSFQKVDDPTPGKNRIHLDLTAEDLDAEVDRLLGAGATLVARRGDENFRWVTLADPDGNQFCVAGAQEASGLDAAS